MIKRWQILLVIGIEIGIGIFTWHPLVLVVCLLVNTLFYFWYTEKVQRIMLDERSRQVDMSIKINETLPYLQSGLNEHNAPKIVEIIQEISQVPDVVLTDRERVLGYFGNGCQLLRPGDKILTNATQEVIRTGEYKLIQTQKEFNCPHQEFCHCPLVGAIIVPVVCKGTVVGTFQLRETREGRLSPYLIRLALGMSQLLGMQIELAKMAHQARLTAEAQLDALQAQINPHFFFNVLNTIVATSRSNPNRARRLLIHLAEFFRRAFKAKGTVIPLKEELEFVNTYLILEKARFGRKLRVKEEIPEELKHALIPRLSIQPLVENAVKHGINPKLGNGTVRITIARDGTDLVIQIQDDGVGIREEDLNDILMPGYGSGNGVGMANVHERLKGLYGESYGLTVQSKVGLGTTVTMRLPLSWAEDSDELHLGGK